jgi:hypothetical protein
VKVVRGAIGVYALVYLLARLPELARIAQLPASQFAPVGVVRLLDAPLPAWLVIGLAALTIVAMVGFVAGVRWAMPIAAALLTWTLSYRNAWGVPFHTENLLVLHVIAIALVRDDRRALRVCAALTVATYLLAGIAKLRLTGMAWVDGEQLRNQIAVDNLRKALVGEPTAPLAAPLLSHPAWFSVVSVATLVVELGAPIALVPRLARYWVAAAWAFHVGVILMMNIWFPYPLFGVAFLPMLPAERLWEWARTRLGFVTSRFRLPPKLQT